MKESAGNILKEWSRFYIGSGLESKLTEAYLEYVGVLVKNKVPPILDFAHLSSLLGIENDALTKMVNSPDSFYRTFEIPKRSGGKRTITAPYPSLKYVQRWIYENILLNLPVHGCANGFIRRRSTLTNVKPHLGQKYLLKIDLKDFFPSIPIEWVIRMFSQLGYEHHVAYYLASLCCFEQCLAQGSPVSPSISNIVSLNLDRRLYRAAKKLRLRYSRYADDLVFSGENINERMMRFLIGIIKEFGYEVNHNKVRLYGEHGNKIVTGISLAEGRMRLPRDYRRKLHNELHFIEKYGLRGHMRSKSIRNPHYLESLIGKLNYWLMVEPENEYALTLRNNLTKLYRNKLSKDE